MSRPRSISRQLEWLQPLFRYGVVGLTTNLAGYLSYLGMTRLGVEPKLAMTTLYVGFTAASYFANRIWTFSYSGALLHSGTRYFAFSGLGYLINLAILLTMVDRLGYPHAPVQAAATVIVALFQFTAFRLWVFSRRKNRDLNV